MLVLDNCWRFLRRTVQEAYHRRHVDYDSSSLSDESACLVHGAAVEGGKAAGGEEGRSKNGDRCLTPQEEEQGELGGAKKPYPCGLKRR